MSTSTTASAVRRLQQVYVEIPPSPLHSNRRVSVSNFPSGLSSFNGDNLKENTFPQSSNATKSSNTPSNKRKLSDATRSFIEPVPKRPKAVSVALKPNQSAMSLEASDQLMLYCHQCNKKRKSSDVVQCTFRIAHVNQTSRSAKEHRCNTKYCRSCLKNRYHEDLDRIKMATKGQKENGHAFDANYVFKCHKCRGQCNCWRCRKQAGMGPESSRKPTVSSNTIEGESHPTNAKSHSKPVLNSSQRAVDKGPKAKSAAAQSFRSIPLPIVKWTRLPVQISPNEAEDRFFIREFMLRFSAAMGRTISKAHLEELEHICDTVDSDSDVQMPAWVSEACVRSIILGLLSLLANEEESSACTVLKTAMKNIHACGVNLTKIWGVLSSLRSSLGPPDDRHSETSDGSESSEDRIILEFPDPLPAPPNSFNYATRTTRLLAEDTLLVTNPAQMVPVIVGLIETAIESQTIRDEIDEGVRENKEKFRESRESMKRENERWEQRKKELEGAENPEAAKIKSERQEHKLNVQAIDNAFKVVSSSLAPRFSPLGTDPDGRVYWALSPGVYDREYAMEYISAGSSKTSKSKKSKGRKYRHKKDEEDRKSFREWSWFLAVWGKRPDAEKGDGSPRKSAVNHTDDADEDGLGWWVFWNPEDIHKLAEWLSVKNNLAAKTGDGVEPLQQQSSSSQAVTTLVKSLREYATVLEWRVKGEDE